MDIREKMRRDWDRRAKVDPRFWVAATEEADETSYFESAERDTRAFVEGLRERVGAEGRLLDLGCGIGRMTEPLGAYFTEVVGVDVSAEMIDKARELHSSRPNVRYVTNSGADLSAFGDGSFDAVCSYSVLPHLPPDVVRAYFREINRVLRPGGWFRYQFWVGPERTLAANDTLNIRVYTPEIFQQLNRDAGLAVREMDEIDYFDPVLELKPVWINAERVGDARPIELTAFEREAEHSTEEQQLEYGLILYLAVKHAERGQIDDAEAVLEDAIKCDPDRPEAYAQWASHRVERGDLKGALVILEQLVERQPALAEGWLYLAQVAATVDDHTRARGALARFDMLGADERLIKEADAVRAILPAVPTGRRRKRKKVVKRTKKRR